MKYCLNFLFISFCLSPFALAQNQVIQKPVFEISIAKPCRPTSDFETVPRGLSPSKKFYWVACTNGVQIINTKAADSHFVPMFSDFSSTQNFANVDVSWSTDDKLVFLLASTNIVVWSNEKKSVVFESENEYSYSNAARFNQVEINLNNTMFAVVKNRLSTAGFPNVEETFIEIRDIRSFALVTSLILDDRVAEVTWLPNNDLLIRSNNDLRVYSLKKRRFVRQTSFVEFAKMANLQEEGVSSVYHLTDIGHLSLFVLYQYDGVSSNPNLLFFDPFKNRLLSPIDVLKDKNLRQLQNLFIPSKAYQQKALTALRFSRDKHALLRFSTTFEESKVNGEAVVVDTSTWSHHRYETRSNDFSYLFNSKFGSVRLSMTQEPYLGLEAEIKNKAGIRKILLPNALYSNFEYWAAFYSPEIPTLLDDGKLFLFGCDLSLGGPFDCRKVQVWDLSQ